MQVRQKPRGADLRGAASVRGGPQPVSSSSPESVGVHGVGFPVRTRRILDGEGGRGGVPLTSKRLLCWCLFLLETVAFSIVVFFLVHVESACFLSLLLEKVCLCFCLRMFFFVQDGVRGCFRLPAAPPVAALREPHTRKSRVHSMNPARHVLPSAQMAPRFARLLGGQGGEYRRHPFVTNAFWPWQRPAATQPWPGTRSGASSCSGDGPG